MLIKFYIADNAVGLMMNNGLAVLSRRDEEYFMQQVSWKGRSTKRKGKSATSQEDSRFEDREGRDFTGDGIIGEPSVESRSPRVIFQGNDEFDAGLYQMNNGDLVFGSIFAEI